MGTLAFYFFVAVFLLALYFKKFELLLFTFPILAYLNLDELLTIDAQLFGVLNLFELNSILLAIVMYNYVPTYGNVNPNYQKYYKVAIIYFLYCFLFEINYSFRIHISRGTDIDYASIIRRFLRYCVYFVTFIIVLKRINNKKALEVLDRSIIVFCIFFALSTLLYNTEVGGIRNEINISQVGRNSGLFLGGDENFLASILGMFFGYIIANIERNRIKRTYYIAIIFIIFGIITTGSRGGLIGIIAIFTLYLLRNPGNKILTTLTIGIGSALLIFFIGDNLIDRLLLQSNDLYNTESAKYYGLYGRIYKWIAYIQDIIDNPTYLILGTYGQRPYWWGWSPHNVFIKVIYFGGLLFLFPLIKILTQLFYLPKSNNNRAFSLVYVLIPFIGMYMELNNVFYFILPILVMMSYGYSNTNMSTKK